MFKLIIVTMGLLGPVPEIQAQVFLNEAQCERAYIIWELTNELPPVVYRSHECVRSL